MELHTDVSLEDISQAFLQTLDRESSELRSTLDELKVVSEKVERLRNRHKNKQRVADHFFLCAFALAVLSVALEERWVYVTMAWRWRDLTTAGWMGLVFAALVLHNMSPVKAEERLCGQMSGRAAAFLKTVSALEPLLMDLHGSCLLQGTSRGSSRTVQVGSRALLLLSDLSRLRPQVARTDVPQVIARFSKTTEDLQLLRHLLEELQTSHTGLEKVRIYPNSDHPDISK